MFRLADDLRVYLHREPIDFRAGINSLAILVEQSMGLNPFDRAVFAFCNRRRTRMKLLFFDRSGFVLVLKALSEDKFHDCKGQLIARLPQRGRHSTCHGDWVFFSNRPGCSVCPIKQSTLPPKAAGFGTDKAFQPLT